MRHDKHKAKRSARYKKQHGLEKSDSVSRGIKTKAERKEGVDHDLNEKEKSKSVLIAEQREQDTKGYRYEEKSYSRRKIESNWSKYEDFSVEDIKEEETHAARGADFKTLISQPDGAASQLRMKDEKWDESDALHVDEQESDVGDLFKVDFQEVGDRLQAIPLHQRLGIPEKYFERSLLALIKDEADRHATRVEGLLKEEQASRIKKESNSSISVARDSDYEHVSADRDSVMVETTSHTASCNDEHIDRSIQTNSSRLESTLGLHQIGDSVASGTCDQDVSSTTVPHRNLEDSRTDSSSTESPLPGKSAEVPSETQSKDTDDLEDWLDEHLLDSD